VTWPEPELDDGAAADFSPPEAAAEPELAAAERPELVAERPEPLELPELVRAEVLRCGAVPRDAAAAAAGWALAALARPTAMPPPARTLAAPTAAVTARRRPWPRFRSAARAACLPLSTLVVLPLGRAAGWRCPARMAGALLRGLCRGCEGPVNCAAVDRGVDGPVESGAGQGINGRCPVDDGSFCTGPGQRPCVLGRRGGRTALTTEDVLTPEATPGGGEARETGDSPARHAASGSLVAHGSRATGHQGCVGEARPLHLIHGGASFFGAGLQSAPYGTARRTRQSGCFPGRIGGKPRRPAETAHSVTARHSGRDQDTAGLACFPRANPVTVRDLPLRSALEIPALRASQRHGGWRPAGDRHQQGGS
jgi:hypothetical protein